MRLSYHHATTLDHLESVAQAEIASSVEYLVGYDSHSETTLVHTPPTNKNQHKSHGITQNSIAKYHIMYRF